MKRTYNLLINEGHNLYYTFTCTYCILLVHTIVLFNICIYIHTLYNNVCDVSV